MPVEKLENGFAVVWFSNAMEKILRTTAEQPPSNKEDRAVTRAARNEYESFQIIVSSKTSVPKTFTVSITDFQGDSGSISRSNVELYYEEYVDVSKWVEQDADGMPFLVEGPEKLRPDPLVPKALETAPLSVQAKQNQPLWFTVYVPKNTPKGVYAASVSVKFSSGEVLVKRVVLEVYDFTLPDEFALKSLFGLAGIIYHFKSTPSDSAYNAMVQKYYAEFKKNRLNPFLYDGAFSPMKVSDGGWRNIRFDGGTSANSINFAFFESAAQQNMALFNTFIFAGKVTDKNYFPKYGSPEDEASFKFFFTQVRSYLLSKGWYDKAIYYLWDEPAASKTGEVNKYGGWIKESGVAPDLPLAITLKPGNYGQGLRCESPYTPNFFKDFYSKTKNSVDIWALQTKTLSANTYALTSQWRADGETLWAYDTSFFTQITHSDPGITWYNLESLGTGIANRIWPWFTARFGATGVMYYYVNYYPCANNPWKNPVSICKGVVTVGGEGAYFYPPCKESASSSCKGIRDDETIIPSIRWELLREGMEDYEYFTLLTARIKSSGDPAGLGHSALVQALALVGDGCYYGFQPGTQKYYDARNAMAKAIVALK
ncbi:MAG: hypothetical protein V1834_03390 [Candidatus Micrarchaeota archaeon]